MRRFRFAAIGAGFWARFQLHGWQSAGGAECVALCDRDRAKAEALAAEFNISAVYDDAAELLRNEKLDFIDIITGPEAHAELVRMAVSHSVPVVCQKPMAVSYEEAENMVDTCRMADVPLYVNENWRWQTSIRELKSRMQEADIGEVFRARIRMVSGFALFDNQPCLRDLEQFILTDIGSHLLDVARFLFGEAELLYCQTYQAHRDIRGEDVATVMLKMIGGATVLVEMGYAENFLERDRFPETAIFIEATRGSAELDLDHWIRITTKGGTQIQRIPPTHYSWADYRYDAVHSSIVPCQTNLLSALHGETEAETKGEDNLKSLRLVFASYESARNGHSVRL